MLATASLAARISETGRIRKGPQQPVVSHRLEFGQPPSSPGARRPPPTPWLRRCGVAAARWAARPNASAAISAFL